MGSGGNAAGSGATPASAIACTYGPQFTEGKPTEAARQHCPVQHQEIVTESNEPSRVTVRLPYLPELWVHGKPAADA